VGAAGGVDICVIVHVWRFVVVEKVRGSSALFAPYYCFQIDHLLFVWRFSPGTVFLGE
jgi:hypothetical protein